MADDVDEHGLPIWAATERNKEPIREQLVRILSGQAGLLLEIAAGTGQHAVHLSEALPAFQYQPTDYDLDHIATLAQRVRVSGGHNLLAPVRIDVTQPRWPIEACEVLFTANMLHIAPWKAAEGLMAGAGRLLGAKSLMLTYGPYKLDGEHTAESNAAFDASLRERNKAWGVRDLTELTSLASQHGVALEERIPMPANNFLLVWRRR